MITPNEQDYFEKMLDAKFEALHNKFDHVIKLQTIANGRTSKNEDRIDKLENWRAESHGHWKAASVIGSIIGAIVGLIAAILFR